MRLLLSWSAAWVAMFCLAAQQQEAPPSTPQPGTSNTPGVGTPGGVESRPGRVPGQQNPPFGQQDQRFPDFNQNGIIYLSGKVVMEDGTAPPDQVLVERICNGRAVPEGYTDSKGRFSFQLGQNNAILADASNSGADMDGFGSGPMGGRQPGMMNQTGRGGVNPRDLMGCELRANLAGFQSSLVNLAGRRALDNPDVGTMILHRMSKVDGFTWSATSGMAPKDARKAFEKGREASKKNKLPDAEKELQKAVTSYPKYAVAWYELGTVYQRQNKLDEAAKAYQQAVESDAKYVNPYAMLAKLAISKNDWQNTADYTEKLLKLNPFLSPEIYLYSAVANANLQKLDVAEEHAREAVKMDTQHKLPKANHILGLLLAQKREYSAAAENMRAYLKFAPNAADADTVKKQLAEMESQTVSARENPPANADTVPVNTAVPKTEP